MKNLLILLLMAIQPNFEYTFEPTKVKINDTTYEGRNIVFRASNRLIVLEDLDRGTSRSFVVLDKNQEGNIIEYDSSTAIIFVFLHLEEIYKVEIYDNRKKLTLLKDIDI